MKSLDISIDDALAAAGCGQEDRRALAQLFRGGVQLGAPYHPPQLTPTCFDIEVGFANDWSGSLRLFDRLTLDYRPRKSCGLARIFRFEADADYLRFMGRLQAAMMAGALVLGQMSQKDSFDLALPRRRERDEARGAHGDRKCNALAWVIDYKLRIGEPCPDGVEPDRSDPAGEIGVEVETDACDEDAQAIVETFLLGMPVLRAVRGRTVLACSSAAQWARLFDRLQVLLALGLRGRAPFALGAPPRGAGRRPTKSPVEK